MRILIACGLHGDGAGKGEFGAMAGDGIGDGDTGAKWTSHDHGN